PLLQVSAQVPGTVMAHTALLLVSFFVLFFGTAEPNQISVIPLPCDTMGGECVASGECSGMVNGHWTCPLGQQCCVLVN
ncbi:hypothetical protein V5799_018461, partial [Amblyomma americanum]